MHFFILIFTGKVGLDQTARPLLLRQSSNATRFMILTLVTGFEMTLGSLKCLRSRVFFEIKARRRRRCTMEIEGSKEEETVVKEVYGGASKRGVLGD
nr:hypothetical protein CFP56_37659 [Quercus suber]